MYIVLCYDPSSDTWQVTDPLPLDTALGILTTLLNAKRRARMIEA